MTEQMQPPIQFAALVEQYLGLESMEITEVLLDLCGASIDARALPLLKRRLQEEETQILQHQAHGYIRMREKSEQLTTRLKSLIAVLEEASRGTSNQAMETQC